jgi:hypothetical protein
MSLAKLSKACPKCGVEKPLAQFSKNKRARDGLQFHCKECCKAATATWSKANPGRSDARSAAWRAANPERVKDYFAARYARDKDKISAYSAARYAADPSRFNLNSAEWYAKNAEKANATSAKWQKLNRDKKRIHLQNRRAKTREAGGTLSSDLAARLYKLQNGKCPCCNQPLGDDYHLDHIVPVALGGSNTDSNIQLLRQRCNNQKRAKHPIDFMRSRGFLL